MYDRMMPQMLAQDPNLFVPQLEGARLFALEQRADLAAEQHPSPLSAEPYRAALAMMGTVLTRATQLTVGATVLDVLMARYASVNEKVAIIAK